MFKRRLRSISVAATCAALVATSALAAATGTAAAAGTPSLPKGFVLLDSPSGQSAGDLTDFSYLPDGTVLSIGKQGKVSWVAADGHVNQLTKLSVVATQDLGLVGLAVAPDYATSKKIYLARSVPNASGYSLRVASWTVTGAPEPTGLANEQILLDFPGKSDTHAVTGLVAAPDGTVWASSGDNADFRINGDPAALRAQSLDQPQGKVLHMTADGKGVPGNPYYDPANPGSVRSKVFASGFRSPFRFSLDPGTGLPIVGDVGNQTWEEIDLVQPGGNYKWPCWEANDAVPAYAGAAECKNLANTPPLWAYHHGNPENLLPEQGNSVSGGLVYTGESYPEQYRGAYFFGDYVGTKIWSLKFDAQGKLTTPPQNPPFATNIGGPVKFTTATNGDLVYADIYTGKLRRLVYSDKNALPVAKITSTTDPATRTVTFDGSESFDYDGDTKLTYSWDFGDGSSATGAKVTHAYAAGTDKFTATLTVKDSLGGTGTATTAVAPGNHTPVIELTTPGTATFAVAEPVAVSAKATDAEDGDLAVEWTSLVKHCPGAASCHSHFGPSGTGASFSQPFTDHPDSKMEFTATVTDKAGVTTTATYLALPREHRVTLKSNVPAMLSIPTEGDGTSTQLVTEGTKLGLVAADVAADGAAVFTGWNDGATAAQREIVVGATDITLTANYGSPIEARYNAEPVLQQTLGAPTGPEIGEANLRYRTYQRGRLYWTKQYGVHEIHDANNAKFLALGGHAKFGAPITDELRMPDGVGRYNDLAGTPATLAASIYWTAANGSFGIWGSIREKWVAQGGAAGPIGYPVTDELTPPDGIGRFNHFTGTPGTKAASIYWSPANGAHSIWGSIRERWSQIGWETGPLGYPSTDELTAPDGIGRFNHFDKAGSIYWTPSTPASDVYGSIRVRWAALGWEKSYLGYPRSGEFGNSLGRRNDFQRGYIQWYSANNTVADRPY